VSLAKKTRGKKKMTNTTKTKLTDYPSQNQNWAVLPIIIDGTKASDFYRANLAKTTTTNQR
jgi:hypothetical protein